MLRITLNKAKGHSTGLGYMVDSLEERCLLTRD